MLAASPVATTFAGQLIVYVVFPLVVAGTLAGGTLALWVIKKILTHDTALTLLVTEVNPPERPSLRDLLGDVRAKQGEMATDAAVAKQRLDSYLDPSFQPRRR